MLQPLMSLSRETTDLTPSTRWYMEHGKVIPRLCDTGSTVACHFFSSFHFLQCLVHRRNPMVAHYVHRNKEHNDLCRHRDLLPLLHPTPRYQYSTYRNLHFRRWSHNFYPHWLLKSNACQQAFNSWCPTPTRWLYLHHRATHL